MKKLFLIAFTILLAVVASSQPVFDLGLKGGLTNSELSFKRSDYTSETILKYHIGAFSRIGWDRVFIQPEVYFNSKGGDFKEVSGSPLNSFTYFNYTSVDVPALLGVKLIKGDFINVRLQGGPVFGFLTSKEGRGQFNADYLRKSFFGWQYGLGVDVWFITLDARFENSGTKIYESSDINSRSKTFMLSAGIKLF